MVDNRIEYIYRKYLTNTVTPEEEREFMEWVRLPQNESAAKELVLSGIHENNSDVSFDDMEAESIIQAILLSDKENPVPLTADFKSAVSNFSSAPPVHRIHFLKTTWFRYAAVLLLLAGTVTFLYTINRPQQELVQQLPDLPPGGDRAILTLTDGSTIVLDSVAVGNLAQQGGTQILKLDAGALAYQAGNTNGKVGYNTLATPKGGRYQITLPDGTKVWLNAASSIRFPTAFGKNRTVEITGESYLEVAANKSKPFFVKTGTTTLQVLGTRFNVNAYPDEPAVKTSLLEGSVKIDQTILYPGEAYIAGKVVSTDMEQDLAWKNGIFNFNKISLEQAMRQIGHWYDIEVVYAKGIPDITFYGEISRGLKLSQVLLFLQGAGVHFKVDDHRITILP